MSVNRLTQRIQELSKNLGLAIAAVDAKRDEYWAVYDSEASDEVCDAKWAEVVALEEAQYVIEDELADLQDELEEETAREYSDNHEHGWY